nr:MAG TPA: hypothetical protein [Caudoviricetes sp.]
MDIDMLLSIISALIAFIAGALMARDTDLPIWTLCLVYLVALTLVHVVGFYFHNN